MIIILDGTDGVGKTTIAKAMAEELGYDYMHAGPPTEMSWREEYIEPLVKRNNLVIDRWHMGEAVWPQLFHRPPLFPNMQAMTNCFHALHIMGHAKGGLRTILVTRPVLDIKDELHARGEDEADVERSLAAQREFLRVSSYVPFQADFRVQRSDDLWARWVDKKMEVEP